MNKEYNNIELTEDEIQSIENEITESPTAVKAEPVEKTEADNISEEETTTEESSTANAEEANDTDVVDESSGFEIDGQTYELDEILAWRDDSNNKTEWQKSNTEKAQNLSKWGKLSEKINEDDAFRNHIKDFFYDNPEEVKKLGLDGEIDLPSEDIKADTTSEIPSELEERLATLEKFEGERVMENRVDRLDNQLSSLEKDFPEYLEGEKVAEFLDFADKNASRFTKDGLPNLNLAFKEWSYDEMQIELAHYKKLEDNKSRNKGKVINTSQVGAKEVKTNKKLSRNWKDITMADPEIAKYFEK